MGDIQMFAMRAFANEIAARRRRVKLVGGQ
jgi:hypothetical protein